MTAAKLVILSLAWVAGFGLGHALNAVAWGL